MLNQQGPEADISSRGASAQLKGPLQLLQGKSFRQQHDTDTYKSTGLSSIHDNAYCTCLSVPTDSETNKNNWTKHKSSCILKV